MRLIDADKLKSELFDADWMMDNDEHMVEKIVERQPTVDAEPVRHGRWIRNPDDVNAFFCSLCGCWNGVWWNEFAECTLKFCPWCGAKMDSKEEQQ